MNVDRELHLPLLSDAEVAEMAQLGIVRRPIDSFGVGSFRYSNLKDAIAEARRQLANQPAAKADAVKPQN